MRKIITNLLAAVTGIMALALPALAQMPPAVVKVELVVREPLAAVSQVAGTVVSRNDARLSAEVEGRLIEVADVGTRVSQGDAVAKIEDTVYRLRQEELQADISRAQSRVKFLESEEKRFARLAESNLAAATQLDQTRSERDVARSDLRVARSRLAQNNDLLARTTVSAPFDGVVVERLMTPGERANEGGDVIRLVDQQNLEVIARAPLENYAYVSEGMELEIRAGPQMTSGVVRTVVAVGDENTHQFEMRIDLAETRLPVGQTVRVAVPVSEVKEVLTVPRDALVLRPEGITVFVVDNNNTAQRVDVTTGLGAGSKIEVFGALSAGDRVIVRGNERLQPGQAVNIKES